MPLPSADKLKWYFERAESMPPAEFGHRAKEAVAKRYYRRRPPPQVAAVLSPAGSVLGDIALDWSMTIPGAPSYWSKRAADLSAGRVEVLSAVWSIESGRLAWHCDPNGDGGEWPLSYCFDIDYRHSGSERGEIRRVWELNRLLWLLPAAAHAATTNNDATARLIDALIRDWIEANPRLTGINWGSGVEMAHQIVALVTLHGLLSRSPDHVGHADHVDADDGREADAASRRRLIAERVADLARWTDRFPSLYSSANNHRLSELGACLIAGIAVPGTFSNRHLDRLQHRLEEEARCQHSRDGLNAEAAPAYGRAVLEWLALTAVVCEKSGRQMSQAFLDLLADSARTLDLLTDCGGNLVKFGDDDGEAVLCTALPEGSRWVALQQLVPGFEPAAQACNSLTIIGDGGYSVARHDDPLGETHLVFDHAALGYGNIAAHGHADALAIWVSVAGRPVVVEAGTYLYHGAGDWRAYFRSTRAHNTLTVAGLDSSQMSGPFNWRRSERAHCRVELRDTPSTGARQGTSDGPWSVTASHDGYLNRLGVRHRRQVARLAPGRYRVTDSLSGEGAHQVSFSLLLAHDVYAESLDPSKDHGHGWSLVRDGSMLGRVLICSDGFRTRISRDGSNPKEGWCSPTFGVLEPASQLFVEGRLLEGEELVVDLDLTGPTK